MTFGFPDDALITDTRCGSCGERLYAEETRPVAWTLKCGCGGRVISTTRAWIEAEFCEPFAGTGTPAPMVPVF